MASSSDHRRSGQKTSEELDELLGDIEKLLERTKVMFEQYFMGIQKMPPSQLHRDIERRIRDLTQDQIRNTGLRFRFTTIQQKYGSYNTYWRRVLRQIEQGTYIRDLQRVSRKAAQAGAEVPEELLVKLPKLMQDKIRRDRALLVEQAARQGKRGAEEASLEGATVPAVGRGAATVAPGKQARGVFTLEDDDFDDDAINGMFDAMTSADDGGAKSPPRAAAPASLATPAPASPAAVAKAPPATPRAAAPPPPLPRSPSPLPRAAMPPAAGVVPPAGMNEKQCRDLYSKYIKARELVGQAPGDVSYEKMVASLSKQAPGIMKEHGAKGVEFNVVIKGDKVVLKAKPQK